jgi:hypothetical protein
MSALPAKADVAVRFDNSAKYAWKFKAGTVAVAVEPVSIPKFPANREKNREYCRIAASGIQETVKCIVVTGFPREFPSRSNRELFRRNREFGLQNPKSSSDEVFGTHKRIMKAARDNVRLDQFLLQQAKTADHRKCRAKCDLVADM